MTKINIADLIGHDSKSLLEFLSLQGDTAFEITIPRPPILADESMNDVYILLAYLHAGYGGHLLEKIADSFAYNVPSVRFEKPFVMEATVIDMERFSTQLLFMANGLKENSDNDAFLDFQEKAVEFVQEISDDIWECSTAGLMVIVSEYIQKIYG